MLTGKEVIRLCFAFVLLYVVFPSLLRTWNWGKDELALVDLVSHFKETQSANDFYSWLGVEQTADTVEIGRAHRKLVVQWHPDTTTNEEDKENYKMANDIARALKSPKLRRIYDHIHRNGIPRWRGFYHLYTHHKLLCMFVALIVIASVMEYVKMWDSYFSEKTTLDLFVKNAQKMASRISEKHSAAKTHNSFIDLGDGRVITCEITPDKQILVSDQTGQMVPLSSTTLVQKPSFLNCFFMRVPRQWLSGQKPTLNTTTKKTN